MDSVVGIARPYSRNAITVSLSSSSQNRATRTKHLQSSSLDILATDLHRDREFKWVGEVVVESSVVVVFLEKPKRRALHRVRDILPRLESRGSGQAFTARIL